MVDAIRSSSVHRNPKNPPSLHRPPLIPADKDNAKDLTSRRTRTKEISSRYLSSPSTSSSSSTSTSTSSTSNSSSNSRRFPSPVLNPRPSTPPKLSQPKRSHSVDRRRPSTPQQVNSNASKTLTTTTRSLSVSFQGESFSFQTSKAKSSPSPNPNPNRKPILERRRQVVPTVPSTPSLRDRSENSRPSDGGSHSHRWPAARQHPNPLSRSPDCTPDKRDPVDATVRLLHQSSVVLEDGTRRISFDSAAAADSDTVSVSSGSNSGTSQAMVPPLARGISIPARFWQETNSRLRNVASPKVGCSVKRSLMENTPVSSPRLSVGSPTRGPVRPSWLSVPPSRGTASPVRMRANGGNSGVTAASPGTQPGNAPSIISFAAEVRRAKKGEKRIEEAHLLRLLHNRDLQWGCVNARSDAALAVQRLAAEKKLYNAWIATSELCDSVTLKRIKLQLLTQKMKLISILKDQMTYLEQWSHMDRDHSSSLSGTIEALNASTLRLPVVGGARADLQEVKNAVGSTVDVMQAMGSSIFSLLSKAEGTSSLMSELAEVAGQERALLDQSRDLLSTVTAMHVKQCSLQGHLLQLKRRPIPDASVEEEDCY